MPRVRTHKFKDLWDLAARKLPKDREKELVRQLQEDQQPFPMRLAQDMIDRPGSPDVPEYTKAIENWNPEMTGTQFDWLSNIYFPNLRKSDDSMLYGLWHEFNMPQPWDTKLYRSKQLPYTDYPIGFQIQNKTMASSSMDPEVAKGYAIPNPGYPPEHKPVMFEIDTPKDTLLLPRPGVFHSEMVLPEDSIIEVIGKPVLEPYKTKWNKRDVIKIPSRLRKIKEYAEGGNVVNPYTGNYATYGQGAEHNFFPDRKLPEAGPLVPNAPLPAGVQPTANSNNYSWLGTAAGILGLGTGALQAYRAITGDRRQLTPEQEATIKAGNVKVPDSWTYENTPFSFDTEGNLVPADYSGDIEEYRRNMEMPTLPEDPSMMDRLGQGLDIGSGALGAYGGIEGENYGQALSGVGDIAGGLGFDSTGNYLSGVGDVYSGFDTGNYGQAARGSANLLNQSGYGTVGGTNFGGALAGAGNIYSGIQRGDAQGYAQAGAGALQTAQGLNLLSSGAGAVAGKAVPLIGAAFSLNDTWNSAKVGDKKGAAMNGAMAGAAIGSVVPVIGTAIGAVIGAVVGTVGAAFGDKENPSEAAYGAHKKMDAAATTRGWSDKDINGAVFETIKSHTKSGNIKKYDDVREMYEAFGINKDAHKNYKNVQTQMGSFIGGVIQTAQQMGALPTDPAELAKLDGQQIYQKIVVPAMAAKYKETTGKESTGWTGDKSGALHNLMADWTDWMISRPATGKAKGGLTQRGGNMIPRGGLSMLSRQRQPEDSSSYYTYGGSPQETMARRIGATGQGQGPMPQPSQPIPQPPPQMPQGPPPQMPPGVGQMPQVRRALGGGMNFGYNEGGADRLVNGPGTGRSDEIPARLSDGEYVIDAETVALLGDGSTDEGARRLDALRKKLRMHKGKNLAKGKFSLKAKSPEQYLRK